MKKSATQEDTTINEKIQDLYAEIRYIAYQVECIVATLKQLLPDENSDG